ncbi:MAG: hypothetical protein SPL05_05350 [Eubacteriales bacterium]|nr:hypothetical protein [Eubacteriales bacterium]
MKQKLFEIVAHYNAKNHAVCTLYEDHIVLATQSSARFFPVYDTVQRVIPLSDIERVEISVAGIKLFASKPNAIHFVCKGATRTLGQMYRDRAFPARNYIQEGVQQFCPNSEQDLQDKVYIAKKIKEHIEAYLKQS